MRQCRSWADGHWTQLEVPETEFPVPAASWGPAGEPEKLSDVDANLVCFSRALKSSLRELFDWSAGDTDRPRPSPPALPDSTGGQGGGREGFCVASSMVQVPPVFDEVPHLSSRESVG